ncbi:MAG TPA: PhzF family phenazine biosynthesis isomerase [Haliangiales bacterium]|nr:PhzF family phenazine biosynthesis isomerase [Haliangiales bacterium]
MLEPAHPADLPLIESTVQRLRLDAERLDVEQFVVWRDQGRVLAFGRIKPYDDGVFELAGVAVLEEARGRGLGKLITRALIDRFPARDVWITTDLVEFFEPLGFRRSDVGPAAISAKLERVCASLRTGVVAMVLHKVGVDLVDAFTRAAGEGNRAGVVVDATGLDAAAMQRLARAVAASETAFVAPHLRLRYFTPAAEVPFCGHATLATVHRLGELGRLAPGRHVVRCEAGDVDVELEADGRVWLTPPQPPWRESPIPEKEIFRLLGGDPTMRDRELPILAAGWKLFVPLCRRADLFALAPRWEELAATGFGAFAFTRDAIEPGSVAHARFFAPAVGVREDPVTGAAHGPLAAYLAQRGVLAVPARARAEQGDAMGKPGRVDYDVTAERARIGGYAVTVLTGEARA